MVNAYWHRCDNNRQRSAIHQQRKSSVQIRLHASSSTQTSDRSLAQIGRWRVTYGLVTGRRVLISDDVIDGPTSTRLSLPAQYCVQPVRTEQVSVSQNAAQRRWYSHIIWQMSLVSRCKSLSVDWQLTERIECVCNQSVYLWSGEVTNHQMTKISITATDEDQHKHKACMLYRLIPFHSILFKSGNVAHTHTHIHQHTKNKNTTQ